MSVISDVTNDFKCFSGSPDSYSGSFSFRNPSMILTAVSLMIVPVLWMFLTTF